MGKLAVAGSALIMGGGVSAGGVVLSKMFSFDSTLPKTFDDFKNGNGGGCIQSLFPGLENMKGDGATDAQSSSKITSIFDSNKKGESDGCLIVNWNKKTGSDGQKWEGNFRFLWALQQEDKGFVVFTTDGSGNKLLWKGVAYSLTKTKEKWGFTNKREVKKDHKTDKSTTNSKFPKPNSYLTSKNFWGFVNSQGDMDKICQTSSCTGAMTESFFEGYWIWKGSSGGETKQLGEWTSNSLSDSSNSWWEELFGKDEWDMGQVVEGMTGKWENKVWSGIEKSEN